MSAVTSLVSLGEAKVNQDNLWTRNLGSIVTFQENIFKFLIIVCEAHRMESLQIIDQL